MNMDQKATKQQQQTTTTKKREYIQKFVLQVHYLRKLKRAHARTYTYAEIIKFCKRKRLKECEYKKG